MADGELVRREPGGDGLGLDSSQLVALEKLAELGAEPAPMGKDGKPVYSSDHRIRAYQMVFLGKFGGRQNGAGRPRSKRAAEAIAQHARENLQDRMKRAVERALKKDAGARANLDAIKLLIDIERGERKLQIEEEEHDGNIGNTREEILATLFALVGEPATAQAIEATYEDITDAEVIDSEEESIDITSTRATPTSSTEDRSASSSEADGGKGNSSRSAKDGRHRRVVSANGIKRTKRNSSQDTNPFTEIALRRSEQR